MEHKGAFIVLEGVDGAGTTTHTRELGQRLKARRVAFHTTAEPSGGPVGSLLRQTLTGRMVMSAPEGGPSRPPAWSTMALLFAADRLDHCESEVLPQLRSGVSVISDRYYHSSVAYQSVTGGGVEAIGWIRDLNRYAQRPDLTVVLDVSPEVAAERRSRRRGSVEMFDADEIQSALCAFYATLERHFPGERIVHVDAQGSVEEVRERIGREVDKILER
jgi:dTMP kinase